MLSHAVNKIRKVMLKLHDVFGVLDLLLLIGEAAEPRGGGVRPLLEQGELGTRHTQLVCNDINRQRHAETVKQVHFSVINPLANQLIGNGLDIVTHALDALVGEHLVHQIAIHTMPGWILGQQGFDHFISLLIDGVDVLVGGAGVQQRTEAA